MSTQLFSLKGKVVVITGGAGFLGMQYAPALIEAGATVVLLDNLPANEMGEKAREVLKATNQRDEGPSDRCVGFRVDITDKDEVVETIGLVMAMYSRIDCLVNNAAMNPAVGSPDSANQSVPYENYPLDLWEKELKVNLTGMLNVTQEVMKVMMAQRSGSIVNVGSEVSEVAYDWTGVYPPGKFKSPAYITTKTGVVGLTRALAAYLGPYNVRVNTFSPGGVRTDKMPPDFPKKYGAKNMFGDMAEAGDYNGIIIFLCSDASKRMTGHNLLADGGRTAW